MDPYSVFGDINSFVINLFGIDLSPKEKIKSLMLLLSSNNKEEKYQALEQIVIHSRSSEYQEILCDSDVNFLPVLVGLLMKTKARARSLGCSILWNLSACNNNKVILAAEGSGCILAIRNIIIEDNGESRAKACSALRNLSTLPGNRMALATPSVGIITALSTAVTSDCTTTKIKSCSVIRNLVVFHDSASAVMSTPGVDLIPLLISVIHNNAENTASVHACGAIANLASHHEYALLLCSSGVIPILCAIVSAASLKPDIWYENDADDDLPNKALNALVNISQVECSSHQVISANILPVMINLLSIASSVAIKATLCVASTLFVVETGHLAAVLDDKTVSGESIKLLSDILHQIELGPKRSIPSPSSAIVGNISSGASVCLTPERRQAAESLNIDSRQCRFLKNVGFLLYYYGVQCQPFLGIQYDPRYCLQACLCIVKNLDHREKMFTADEPMFRSEGQAILAEKKSSLTTVIPGFANILCMYIDKLQAYQFDDATSEDSLRAFQLAMEVFLGLVLVGYELHIKKSALSKSEACCLSLILSQENNLEKLAQHLLQCYVNLITLNTVQRSEWKDSIGRNILSIVRVISMCLSVIRMITSTNSIIITAHEVSSQCQKAAAWPTNLPIDDKSTSETVMNSHDLRSSMQCVYLNCCSGSMFSGEVTRLVRDMHRHGVKLVSFEDCLIGATNKETLQIPNLLLFCSDSNCIDIPVHYEATIAALLAARSGIPVIVIDLTHHNALDSSHSTNISRVPSSPTLFKPFPSLTEQSPTRNRFCTWLSDYISQPVVIRSTNSLDREVLITRILEFSSWSGADAAAPKAFAAALHPLSSSYSPDISTTCNDFMNVVEKIKEHSSVIAKTMDDFLRSIGVDTITDLITIEFYEDLLEVTATLNPLLAERYTRALVRMAIACIDYRRQHHQLSQSSVSGPSYCDAWEMILTAHNCTVPDKCTSLLEEWGVLSWEDLTALNTEDLGQLLQLLKLSPRGAIKLTIGMELFVPDSYPQFVLSYIHDSQIPLIVDSTSASHGEASGISNEDNVTDMNVIMNMVSKWFAGSASIPISVAHRVQLETAWEIICNPLKVTNNNDMQQLLTHLGVATSEDLTFLSNRMIRKILEHIKLAQKKRFIQSLEKQL